MPDPPPQQPPTQESSQDVTLQTIPKLTFRKASAIDESEPDNERLVADGFCLQVHNFDVCRICQCGPNTLATPTPLLLTPTTSPKHTTQPSTSTLRTVTIELKRTQPHPQPPSTPKKTQTPDYNLISPCVCSGSLKYVHQYCLQNWIRASNNTACELCKHPFQLRSRFKPLWKWEALPLVPGEKKRIVCSALFHTVALACVVWSLYVLIDRTIEELTHSDLEWQFWTKIIVEAIGCLGAGILAYVWGKLYVSLLIKWISFNRSFVIIGKECSPNQESIVGPRNYAAATHNQELAREQELINLIN